MAAHKERKTLGDIFKWIMLHRNDERVMSMISNFINLIDDSTNDDN